MIHKWRPGKHTVSVSFSQYEPYGPVVESTIRVVTWNVWGRYGRWRERQAGIEEALASAAPDVVCLVESWSHPDADQPELVARRLGFEHSLFAGDWQQEDWLSGISLVSRWPVTSHERRPLRGPGGAGTGDALFGFIEGSRGPTPTA